MNSRAWKTIEPNEFYCFFFPFLFFFFCAARKNQKKENLSVLCRSIDFSMHCVRFCFLLHHFLSIHFDVCYCCYILVVNSSWQSNQVSFSFTFFCIYLFCCLAFVPRKKTTTSIKYSGPYSIACSSTPQAYTLCNCIEVSVLLLIAVRKIDTVP